MTVPLCFSEVFLKTLREMWTSANTTVRVTVIVAMVVLALAGLAWGPGLDWLTTFLSQ
jgi:hypothetical protein